MSVNSQYMSTGISPGFIAISYIKSQLPQNITARSLSFCIITLIESLPHCGHKKKLGNFFFCRRTTFLRLLPIILRLQYFLEGYINTYSTFWL